MKFIKNFFQIALFLGLGIVLIWYSMKDLSGNEIRKLQDLVYRSNWLLVLPCVLILILSHYIRALRWTSMISATGSSPRVLNVFLAVITGFFFNLVFPRLGEVMKCSVLGKYEKIPVDKLIGTMVAERITDLCCLILVILLTIFSQLERVSNYASEFYLAISKRFENNAFILITFLAILLIIVVLIIIFIKQKREAKWVSAFLDSIRGFYAGLISIKNIENKTSFFFQTMLIWTLYWMSIQVGFYAMPGLSNQSLSSSLTILTFGSFAMIATQGGIGAYQLAVQKTLALYGVNSVTGLAFGWLLWSVQTLMLLALGPISLFLLFFTNRKNRQKAR